MDLFIEKTASPLYWRLKQQNAVE